GLRERVRTEVLGARLRRSARSALEQVVGTGERGPAALEPRAEDRQEDPDAAQREILEKRERARLGGTRDVRGDATCLAQLLEVGERVDEARGSLLAPSRGAVLPRRADRLADHRLGVLR